MRSRPRFAKSLSTPVVPPVLAQHLLKGARRENPLVKIDAADAERVLDVLVWTGAEAVD